MLISLPSPMRLRPMGSKSVWLSRTICRRNLSRDEEDGVAGKEALDLIVRHKGRAFTELTVSADPSEPDELRRVLLDVIKRDGWDERRVDEFEMDVRYANDRRLLTTFAAQA